MRAFRRTAVFAILPLLLVGALAASDPTQPTSSTWASLREAQRQTALAYPHAAIAVTVDIGDPADLPPAQRACVTRGAARRCVP